MIHSKALDRDKIPRTMDEWKSTAQNEVARAKEKYNMGLTGVQRRNQQKPRDFRNFQHQPNPLCQQQLNSNLSHVPMDVDAANATQFKKLTLEECAQLAKEGWCFRCRLQGHMALNCPKNTNNNNPTICTNESTVLPKASTPVMTPTTQPSASSTPATKLTRCKDSLGTGPEITCFRSFHPCLAFSSLNYPACSFHPSCLHCASFLPPHMLLSLFVPPPLLCGSCHPMVIGSLLTPALGTCHSKPCTFLCIPFTLRITQLLLIGCPLFHSANSFFCLAT
jgi:hypothetical protein